MNHKIYHKSGRNVGTIANVGTIEGITRVGTISEYLALSEGGFGPTSGKVGTIQGWIWSNIWQSLHYQRVDLDQNWARLALSSMLALTKGEIDPKIDKVATIWAQLGPKLYQKLAKWPLSGLN